MRIHVVDADAYDYSILLCVLFNGVLETVSFDRATRREVLGIEEHNPLALELIKRDLRSFLAGRGEFRGLSARRLVAEADHRRPRKVLPGLVSVEVPRTLS